MNEKSPTVITRQDLYQKIWGKPISHVATEFGISGNGLAKICARLRIPSPPRGYWAKKAAGKKVVVYRLPDPDPDTPLEVRIVPTEPYVPEQRTEVQEQLAIVRTKVSDVTVSERLTRPHPVIARWLAEHQQKKEEAKRERDPWRRELILPTKFTDVDRRKHRILDALFKALEPHGFKIKTDDRQAVFLETNNERVDYELREKLKQVRRPLTDEEKRRGYYGDQLIKREMQPSGILLFSIKTHLGEGLPQSWRCRRERGWN